MMEYRQPVAFSKAVRFLACLREGLVRRTIHRKPCGQPAALVFLHGAVLVHGGLPAGASHELIKHLLSLASRRRTVLFTSGWAITETD